VSVAYDVAVAGLGAMGSAVAHHAARRGLSVAGFDRFAPPHTLGSSHGESRIIREAYFEDPCYVPIVQRAYDLWHALERESGERLMLQTGGLMLGPPDGSCVSGARASGDQHRLPYETLDAAEIRARFPALHAEDGTAGVYEPRAGILFPESCVRAHLDTALRAGATLRTDEPALAWRADGEGIEIVTAKGSYRAARLVLAAGAWLPALVPGVRLPLAVTRQPLFWFVPRANAEAFEPGRLPVYIWEWTRERFFYGFPALGGEVKTAVHHEGEPADPDGARRELAPAEIEAMRERLRRFVPDADGRFSRAAVCLYTNTPDGHFAIDRHPEHPGVVIVSACSGHGFKFSSAIGEIAVQLALGERVPFDLGRFALRW
jgi:sarcosine oxidase